MYAAKIGHMKACMSLIEGGADPCYADKVSGDYSKKAVSAVYVVNYNYHFLILSCALEHGTNVGKVREHGTNVGSGTGALRSMCHAYQTRSKSECRKPGKRVSIIKSLAFACFFISAI